MEHYAPRPDEIAFFKTETGISDDEALKDHIINIQKKAYSIYPYPCIQRFGFTKLRIFRAPAYKRVLELGRTRENPILLDIGCCFGNDVRKVIADGYPARSVIASDLRQEFWELGHELFKSTPESFAVPFIAGDVFDPALVESGPPFYLPPENEAPALTSLTSLNPLKGHISVIHASAFFHLFNEEKQLQVAKILAGLLSPLPGSMIFGQHLGRPEKGVKTELFGKGGRSIFCHSPRSWEAMWDGEVFEKGTVNVDERLRHYEEANIHMLFWSVTRV